MRTPLASLAASLSVLALLFEHTTASAQKRNPEDVEIAVTKDSSCDEKTKDGDEVEIHYNGTLSDGKAFDSSYDRGIPIAFVLGFGEVIEGWDKGLQDMCVGEVRKLTIPASLAYGSQSMPGIPAGSTLVFDTLLVSVKPGPETEEDEAEHDQEEQEEEFAGLEEADSQEDYDEDEQEQKQEVGIMTAPAEPPASETTEAPKTASKDDNAGDHAMNLPPTTHAPKTYGPATPTKLPDLPITGLQGAATAPAAVASQQPIGSMPGSDPNSPGAVDGECRLLGPFALIVQAGLGLLAVSSLVFKRWRERPRRPFKIWFFDASKQVFGSALLHVLNLLMSIFSTADYEFAQKALEVEESLVNEANKGVNPCSWYLINIAIDTTIGIPILVLLLRLLTHLFTLTPLARPRESVKSGHYGTPPRATWWLRQSLIYFLGLCLMKLCVFAIIQILPWIALVGDWALRWTEGNQRVQIAFVMFVFPLIMNALQYYIIDSFIKDQSTTSSHPHHDQEDSDASSGSGSQQSYHSIEYQVRDSMDSQRSGEGGDDDAVRGEGKEAEGQDERLLGPEPGGRQSERGQASREGSSSGHEPSPSRKERLKDA